MVIRGVVPRRLGGALRIDRAVFYPETHADALSSLRRAKHQGRRVTSRPRMPSAVGLRADSISLAP